MQRAVLIVALGWGLVCAPDLAGSAHAAVVHDVPLPRGSRSLQTDVFMSRRGFRQTVRYYRRWLKRQGLPHQAVPIYRYRGVTVARFLATGRDSKWQAIQVFHLQGRTHIAIIPNRRQPLDDSVPAG